MNTINDIFGVHEQALTLKSKRLELLASNISNADTPHFKARDIDFAQALKRAGNSLLRSTDSRHFDIEPQGAPADSVKYRVPFNVAADGNTVEIGVEQAQYGKAAGDYRASLAFIENRTSAIRRALKGE
jgi:flagellar basal-body rod protein FlgB